MVKMEDTTMEEKKGVVFVQIEKKKQTELKRKKVFLWEEKKVERERGPEKRR